MDPKLAWALKHRVSLPRRRENCRAGTVVAGSWLGTRAVDRIIASRRTGTLRLDDVARLTGAIVRARPSSLRRIGTPGDRSIARSCTAVWLPAPNNYPCSVDDHVRRRSAQGCRRGAISRCRAALSGCWRGAAAGGVCGPGDETSLLPPVCAQGAPPQALTVPRGFCRFVARRRMPQCARSLCPAVRRAMAHRAGRPGYRHACGRSGNRPSHDVREQRAPRHSQDACVSADFVRRSTKGNAIYTAWFEPQHYILKRAVPFFVDRFTNMQWLIATPLGTALWRAPETCLRPADAKAPSSQR